MAYVSLLGKQIKVPDALLKELASLRVAYAYLLYIYKRELQSNPEAEEVFLQFLPGLLRRRVSSERSLQSYFDTLIDEEVSLFNITYLEQICTILPGNVW